MHDINGKALHLGSEILTYAYGMLIIKEMKEEHNPDEGGALIECIGVGKGGGSISVRTHRDQVRLIRPWKTLAQEALDVQNASNLSGVANSFADVVREVRTRLEAEGAGGNRTLHNHPIIQVWADKIASLTGTQASVSWAPKAYDEVNKLAGK
jgi:hypothetical protein